MEYKLKEYGLDQFVSKSKNLLFVTGMPGSGKSTLSKKLAEKYSAIYLELDWFFHLQNLVSAINSTEKQEPLKKEAMIFLRGFFLRHKYVKICDYDSTRITALPELSSSGIGEKIVQLIQDCAKQKPKQFVLEGIHIYTYTGLFDVVKQWPIVLMLQDEKESYVSAKRRTHDYKKKVVKGIRGKFLLPWEKDFDKSYYARVGQLYQKFVAKIDDYKGADNMESRQLNAAALESLMIPDSEHLGYVGVEPATELFGMGAKQTQKYKVMGIHGNANSVDDAAVNIIKTYNREVGVPSKKWPDIFIDTWTNTTDKFNKVGVNFVKDYMKKLDAYRKFVEENNDDFVQSFRSRNQENLNDINRRGAQMRVGLVTYNQSYKNILAGIQEPIRADVKKQLKPLLVSYQKDFEDVAHKEARLRDSLVNELNTGFFKAQAAKNTADTAGNMYTDLRLFYTDLWAIMSEYKL